MANDNSQKSHAVFGQFAESKKLEKAIGANLNGLGYGLSVSKKRNLGSCLPQAAEEGLPRSTGKI
jgi:hypothetical protein